MTTAAAYLTSFLSAALLGRSIAELLSRPTALWALAGGVALGLLIYFAPTRKARI
jgi:hypothetical protein